MRHIVYAKSLTGRQTRHTSLVKSWSWSWTLKKNNSEVKWVKGTAYSLHKLAAVIPASIQRPVNDFPSVCKHSVDALITIIFLSTIYRDTQREPSQLSRQQRDFLILVNSVNSFRLSSSSVFKQRGNFASSLSPLLLSLMCGSEWSEMKWWRTRNENQNIVPAPASSEKKKYI